MLSLSEHIRLGIHSLTDVQITVRIGPKIYRFAVGAKYRRQLYRATSDVIDHGPVRELDRLKFKASGLLLKMQTLIHASNEALVERTPVNVVRYFAVLTFSLSLSRETHDFDAERSAGKPSPACCCYNITQGTREKCSTQAYNHNITATCTQRTTTRQQATSSCIRITANGTAPVRLVFAGCTISRKQRALSNQDVRLSPSSIWCGSVVVLLWLAKHCVSDLPRCRP